MARYRGISRRQQRVDRRRTQPEPQPDYRSLQQQAKEAGIPANQSREALEEALTDG